VFAFHDGDDIGPRMLVRVAKHTPAKLGKANPASLGQTYKLDS